MLKLGHKDNKAQTTLFAILGIAIIVLVAAFLLLRPEIAKLTVSEEQARKMLAAEKGNVEEYVKDCVRTSALKNLNTLGRQGGWIMQNEEHFSVPVGYMDDATVINYAYYYDKELETSVNKLPSMDEMKDELVNGISLDIGLLDCLELKPFTKKFFVSTSYLDVDTDNMVLGKTTGGIIIPFSYPVTLSLRGVAVSLEKYSVAIPVNLYKIRDAAAIIVNIVAEGGSLTMVQKEIALSQALELRQNTYADKMTINAVNYNWVPSDSSIYNTRNTFYTIAYEAQGLDKPYIFNFLIGKE